MNYFLDTEFYENGTTIELISIAIVCADGRELYCENSEFNWYNVPEEHWIQANVRPHLWAPPRQATTDELKTLGGCLRRDLIADQVQQFVREEGDDVEPRLWGFFADYDWIVLCQLFGTMMQLPPWFPKFCMDLKQSMVERGLSSEWKRTVCPDPKDEHHALADARWNRDLYKAISAVDSKRPLP